MIKQGLSDKTIQTLKSILLADAYADTDLALKIKQYVEQLDYRSRHDDLYSMFKTLQAFVNPTLYSKVYEAELEKAKADRIKQIKPEGISQDTARQIQEWFVMKDKPPKLLVMNGGD